MITALMFQFCVATKIFPESEFLKKVQLDCQNPEIALITMPSRGLLPDAMSIRAIKTSGNGGIL